MSGSGGGRVTGTSVACSSLPHPIPYPEEWCWGGGRPIRPLGVGHVECAGHVGRARRVGMEALAPEDTQMDGKAPAEAMDQRGPEGPQSSRGPRPSALHKSLRLGELVLPNCGLMGNRDSPESIGIGPGSPGVGHHEGRAAPCPPPPGRSQDAQGLCSTATPCGSNGSHGGWRGSGGWGLTV